MQQLVPQRDIALENEMSKQQRNERLRQQFALQANKLGPWLERQLDSLFAAQTANTNVAPAAGSQLEKQLADLRRTDEEVARMRPSLIEMERNYQVANEILFSLSSIPRSASSVLRLVDGPFSLGVD